MGFCFALMYATTVVSSVFCSASKPGIVAVCIANALRVATHRYKAPTAQQWSWLLPEATYSRAWYLFIW